MSITEIGSLLVFGDSYAIEIIVPSLGGGERLYWSDDLKMNLRIRNDGGWTDMQFTQEQAAILASVITDFAPPGNDLYEFAEHLYDRSSMLARVNIERRAKHEEAKRADASRRAMAADAKEEDA